MRLTNLDEYKITQIIQQSFNGQQTRKEMAGYSTDISVQLKGLAVWPAKRNVYKMIEMTEMK